MPEQSVVITGATSGLGEQAATILASLGWHVVLGFRDPVRAEETVAGILRRHPQASVETLRIDLADLRSVSAAVTDLRGGNRPPIMAVIANGAIQIVDGVRSSADGFELTFATNHLGHFALVTGLVDDLPHGARVIIVSSGTHAGALGFPGPQWRPAAELANPAPADASPSAGRRRYSTSKLANLYFSYELARRVRARGITVVAYDPGLMPATSLSRDYPRVARIGYRTLAPLVAALLPGARTASASARFLVDLVVEDRFAGVTGRYVAGPDFAKSSPESYDSDRARRLWRDSEQLVRRAVAEDRA